MKIYILGAILGVVFGAIFGYVLVLIIFASIASTGESPIVLYGAVCAFSVGAPIGAVIGGLLGYYLGDKLEVNEDS